MKQITHLSRAGSMLLVAFVLHTVAQDSVSSDAPLTEVDLSDISWHLTNSNRSISTATTLPVHVLGALINAGIVAQDPLYRYGELECRWVSEETWNFTLIWHIGNREVERLMTRRHVMLVLQGVDTFGDVILNGQHLLKTNNAHRSWWVELSSDMLQAGSNMLTIVLHPAVTTAVTARTLYPYSIPTMRVPGGFDVYNFARKPAADFGWDWGPSFSPAGITGAVQLVGYDTAAVIGALTHQEHVKSANSSSSSSSSSALTIILHITAQFVVPAAGDEGQLTVDIPQLQIKQHKQVTLTAAVVGGNPLQALVTMQVYIPPAAAAAVKLWQPRGLLKPGTKPALYDVIVTFKPAAAAAAVGSGNALKPGSSSSSSSVTRRIGFRTVELIRVPRKQAAEELLPQSPSSSSSSSSKKSATPQQQQQQQQQDESFYFKVNGVPIYAKGANLIPMHILSTAVDDHDVLLLLQSAAAANMNMIRIWGGGLYQHDALYTAADELGLLIWQEAMFACTPYPRDPDFLSNVEAELIQQILRLGGHPSVMLWGGNNEVEASFDWYNDTRNNPMMYAVDYIALFVDTIGKLMNKMLPGMPWVDSSPSNGVITITSNSYIDMGTGDAGQDAVAAAAAAAGSSAEVQAAAAAAAGSSADASRAASTGSIKRWGNPQDAHYGDVHYYNYKDDCQDWRHYPAAGFISEYGWQSWPSWSTYRQQISQQQQQQDDDDLTVAANMTQFRQRHPNGTMELLAQLERRFRLPDTWKKMLQQQQQPDADQQQQQQQQQQQYRTSSRDTSSIWHAFCARILDGALTLWRRLTMHLGNNATNNTTTSSSSSGSSSGGGSNADMMQVDHQMQQQQHNKQYNEMQHWIYLTQLQQLLCYNTALDYWRRLRSDPDTLTMGVLYWQLNDIWAGASWSSIDYGGVWKPLHYQVSKSFADVSLNIQHNVHNNTLQVHVVSDLAEAVNALMTIRLLSLTDTQDSCSSQNSSSSSSSSGSSSAGSSMQDQADHQHGRILTSSVEQQQQMSLQEHHNSILQKGNAEAATAAADTASSAAAATTDLCQGNWVRYCETASLQLPPRSAVSAFSGSTRLLLAAAPDCGSSSCYIHVTLQAAGHQTQTAVVWLAPFYDMMLHNPHIKLSGFKAVDYSSSALDSDGFHSWELHTQKLHTQKLHTQEVHSQEHLEYLDDESASEQNAQDNAWQQQQHLHEVEFTVRSSRVALYAVWELKGYRRLPGYFSNNAITLHPCEPVQVRFIPHLGAKTWQQYVDTVLEEQQQQQQQQGSDNKATDSSSAMDGSAESVSASKRYNVAASSQSSRHALVDVMKQHLVVSSLFDHQNF